MTEEQIIPGPQGTPVRAISLSFQNSREHWNEYLLDDGTILKLKPVATEVFRILDMYDGQGNPVYLMRSQNVVVVKAPDHLKQRPAQGEQP